jgi:hypothetical protein
MVLALLVLAATALAPILYVTLAPDIDPVQVYLAPAQGGPADATRLDSGEVAAVPGPAATPNHDPHRVTLALPAADAPVATFADAGLVEPTATSPVEPGFESVPSFALEQATLRADPEPPANDLIAQKIVASQQVAPQSAVPPPAFVAADAALYAKGNARLRAAPSTDADVVTRLAADAPLRATARSTDGVWWRVSLTGGRSGYVNQAAVSQTRLIQAQAQPTLVSAPVTTAAAQPVSAQPEWKRRSQELFGYVDKSMSWLADQAGGGPAPKVVRSER